MIFIWISPNFMNRLNLSNSLDFIKQGAAEQYKYHSQTEEEEKENVYIN